MGSTGDLVTRQRGVSGTLLAAARSSGRAVGWTLAILLLIGAAAPLFIVQRIALAIVVATLDGTVAHRGLDYFLEFANLLLVAGVYAAIGGTVPLLFLITLTLAVSALAGAARECCRWTVEP